MSIVNKKKLWIVVFALLTWGLSAEKASTSSHTLKKIIIEGAPHYPYESIASALPYKVGTTFSPEYSTQAIKNLYNLGYFKDIKLATQETEDGIILYISVKEKSRVSSIEFSGNKAVSTKDLSKKISIETIPTADEHDLEKYKRIIKKMYLDKGYNFTTVSGKITKNEKNIDVTFTIDEGPKTVVRRVFFEGNHSIKAQKIRPLLYTKEDWILGMLERAGMFHPGAIEQDKMTIETIYQSNGFMKAQVVDARVDFTDDNKYANVTFVIEEGPSYTMKSVSIPGNDIYTEEELKSVVPLSEGMPYSRELVRLSMENLKKLWGNKGYINANIDPLIQPNEETKEVELTFHSHLGKKVKLNQVNIKGNKKSRDRIVRRMLLVDEGEELTTAQLDNTKDRIKGLGFFDAQEGVNWKLQRIDEETANLDIILKEIKTGRFEYKMNYGGSPNQLSSSSHNVTASIQFMERNLFGKGLYAHTNLQTALFGDTQRSVTFGVAEPWLFDKPIRLGFDGYYNHSEYDEIRKVTNSIQEHKAGFVMNLGYVIPYGWNVSVINQLGFDSFKLYSSSRDGRKNVSPEATVPGNPTLTAELQAILNERMKSGKLVFWQTDLGQDTCNHPMHPSRGHRWIATSKIGFPTGKDVFGFYKLQFDWHWYTPIINEHDLVLHLHTHLGYVNSYKTHSIPFKELYNIGGPASVRGWLFGQISPLWAPPGYIEEDGWQGDPIGGRKAFFLNAELIFPIMKDMSIKGAVFYDGGSGWDTPNTTGITPANLQNNSFDYRHSIGVGIRMTSPQPLRVDWAFKLDKRPGETATEVSFASYYDF